MPWSRATSPSSTKSPGQIRGEITRVGRPVNRFDVDAEFGPVWEPDAEGLEHPESAPHPLADTALGVHREKHPSECRREPRAEVTVLSYLDVLVEVAPAVGDLLELVQHHGLAHTAKTGEHLASPVSTELQSLQCDVHRLDLAVAPDQYAGGRVPAPGLYGFRTGSTPLTI